MFRKLEWSEQESIILHIRGLINEAENRTARLAAFGPRKTDGDNLNITVDDGMSVSSHRNVQFDYEEIRSKIQDYESEGIDMKALRMKIQWEARQLIES